MKLEDIDDFSDSIFSEDPLDNIEGDEQQTNEDEDDMVDVIDANGNIQFVSLDEYEKHRAYYQNNLSKYAKKQSSIKQKQQDLAKFNAIQKVIKEKEQTLKSSYGTNADKLDKELTELKKQRDNITKQIYGKTYNELKRRKQ